MGREGETNEAEKKSRKKETLQVYFFLTSSTSLVFSIGAATICTVACSPSRSITHIAVTLHIKEEKKSKT